MRKIILCIIITTLLLVGCLPTRVVYYDDVYYSQPYFTPNYFYSPVPLNRYTPYAPYLFYRPYYQPKVYIQPQPIPKTNNQPRIVQPHKPSDKQPPNKESAPIRKFNKQYN